MAAEWRDPRSLARALFPRRAIFPGARRRARLLRRSPASPTSRPEGSAAHAPYLAAFARIAPIGRECGLCFAQSAIEDAALTSFRATAANAPAMLALASPVSAQPDSTWLPVLLDNLVKAGDYAKARAIWASVSGIDARSPARCCSIPDFSKPAPPPPFNWALASSTVGLAERQPGGRLHAIFYGQEDGALARQLLVLPPGRYQLSMRLRRRFVAGQGAQLDCDLRRRAGGSGQLAARLAASRGLTFDVPAAARRNGSSCPASPPTCRSSPT